MFDICSHSFIEDGCIYRAPHDIVGGLIDERSSSLCYGYSTVSKRLSDFVMFSS
ncbi:hypothetical protein X975_24524, partial [Stegodyphus mimosarum]